jgi:8-oxo-dGTP pyrophosphatase MutT (NUDIX family)
MANQPADPDDAPFDPADPTRPQRAPKPKDAATLILVRTRKNATEVLMGQRAAGHVFMPDKWVFPGGRLDPTDALAPAASEPTELDADRLKAGGIRRAPRAFGLCAVREVFEETGLIVGARGQAKGKPPRGWTAYASHNAAPELHKLRFVCRAITPPYRPRRFDARFFLADADDVLLDDRPVAGDQELLHTRWFSFAEAMKLDLPSVTRYVLDEIQAQLSGAETGGPPFLRYSRGGHQMDRL